jgi:hypothetical protein
MAYLAKMTRKEAERLTLLPVSGWLRTILQGFLYIAQQFHTCFEASFALSVPDMTWTKAII